MVCANITLLFRYVPFCFYERLDYSTTVCSVRFFLNISGGTSMTQTHGLRSNAEFQPCKPPIWPQFFVSNCHGYGLGCAGPPYYDHLSSGIAAQLWPYLWRLEAKNCGQIDGSRGWSCPLERRPRVRISVLLLLSPFPLSSCEVSNLYTSTHQLASTHWQHPGLLDLLFSAESFLIV